MIFFNIMSEIQNILKRSRDFSPMHKEGNELCIIYMLIKMGPRSRSVFIIFTVRVTKQHPVNISFLQNLVQRIIEAQLILESK